jgi:FkbM family methyltransferase
VQEKNQPIRFRWITRVFGIPRRVRLPFGSWWLAENDALGRAILRNDFETSEWRFVERFLRPGMTVLDVGAHHGFYSLLASQKVGAEGQVVAFEPSPRERRKLLRHLEWNHCTNVRVESYAVGEGEGQADLFLVHGKQTGCNSLRPPHRERTSIVRVPVSTLDGYLRRRSVPRVDFIKLDVEGAELSALKGASELLEHRPRPVILCELQEARTRPWGYAPKEIVELLCALEYRWFSPMADGRVRLRAPEETEFDGNYVAVPAERLEELGTLGLTV